MYSVYIYIYTHMYIHIYIYVDIERQELRMVFDWICQEMRYNTLEYNVA